MYTLRKISKTGMIKNIYLGSECSSITKFPPRGVGEEENKVEFERTLKLHNQIHPLPLESEKDIVAFVLSEGELNSFAITYDTTAYIIGEKGNTITKIN